MLASLSASAIALSKRFLPDGRQPSRGLLQRLGAQTVVAATVRAIQLLGRQFVLGRSIGEAMGEAADARASAAARCASATTCSAKARAPSATRALPRRVPRRHRRDRRRARGGGGPQGGRRHLDQAVARCSRATRTRSASASSPSCCRACWRWSTPAAPADINLTIDAEESDRLELSLDVFEALARAHRRAATRSWRGFGLAVQAYQTRALDGGRRGGRASRRAHGPALHGAAGQGRLLGRRDQARAGARPGRLPGVHAQARTPTSPTWPAPRALIGHADVIYPQFATHNAGTIAAILQMAAAGGAPFEMQRLHGMGEGVYREVLQRHAMPLRVYAPVGEHRDLLAYLVRRLLENGANSSFVHQLADDAVDVEALLASPLARAARRRRCRCRSTCTAARRRRRANSTGVDLACAGERAPLRARRRRDARRAGGRGDARRRRRGDGRACTPASTPGTRARSASAPPSCAAPPTRSKRACPSSAACSSRKRTRRWATAWPRCARRSTSAATTPTRPRRACAARRCPARPARATSCTCTAAASSSASARGTSRSRSSPARSSPRWSPATRSPPSRPSRRRRSRQRFVALLHEAGVPDDALALLHGPGETVGAALVADPRTAGVVLHRLDRRWRGSSTARWPRRTAPIVPLIAETGGLNAMIVDTHARCPSRWSTRSCRAPSAPPASAARRCACCACTRASPTA